MHWRITENEVEKLVASSLRRASHFYRFLWEIRAELFDDEFQKRLIECYSPRGQEPVPPGMLAMVMLLQRYDDVSDADAVECAENDRRWQLVLSIPAGSKSPFGQGTLVRFRTRMIAHGLDKLLVEKTVSLAKQTKKFGWQRLRVALDSSPLEGTGRIDDTWNLIGRAMSKVVHLASLALKVDELKIIEKAKLDVLEGRSVKQSLDIDWDDESEKQRALNVLLEQVERLDAWVTQTAQGKETESPLKDALALMHQVATQDVEPDPTPGGGKRMVNGVARDRIISVGDREMRHGRKSKTVRINGYKRHVVVANGLILATAVMPANLPEYEPTETLLAEAAQHGSIETLDIDRGYLASPAVTRLHRAGVTINSRPWNNSNGGLFKKDDFVIQLKSKTVTCPAGNSAPISSGQQAVFSSMVCGACPLKTQCTQSNHRSISIHEAEDLLIVLRARRKTKAGRTVLRKRAVVEHRLARISAIQGNKARYRGARKNELDVNRAAAVANLYVVAELRR